MRRAKELILNFLCENNLDVGYWDGQKLSCYRSQDANLIEAAEITDIQLLTELHPVTCPIVAALTPELKEQWKREWAETGRGPGMIPFVLNALNPATGKRDGIQYTFGDSHVSQALACYANDAGKLGQIKQMIDHYEDGLKVLGQLPTKLPVRNTLFRVWKTHWEALFQNILDGKAKTYLFNLLASKYRSNLNNDTPSSKSSPG